MNEVQEIVSGKEDNNSKGGKHTALEASAVGLTVGAAGGYALGDARMGGLLGMVAGRAIGEELAQMQKDYKGKELEIIMKIEHVHAQEEDLINKNKILNIEIANLDKEIINLKNQKKMDNEKKDSLYQKIETKIANKKKALNKLLQANKKMKKKIAKSEAKIYQYDYKSKDKQLLQKDLKIMKRASIELKQRINNKIRELDKLKRKMT